MKLFPSEFFILLIFSIQLVIVIAIESLLNSQSLSL